MELKPSTGVNYMPNINKQLESLTFIWARQPAATVIHGAGTVRAVLVWASIAVVASA